MTPYAQKLEQTLADAGSNRRCHDMLRNRFNPHPNFKAPFDDRLRTALTEYALPQRDIGKVIEHLDAVGYGAIHQPQQLMEAIERFQCDHAPSRAWMRGLRRAVKALQKSLVDQGVHGLHVRVFKDSEDIYMCLPKTDAHAGFAYLETGKRTKGEYREELYPEWTKIHSTIRNTGSHGLPLLVGSRLQCSGGYVDGEETDKVKHKERLVNMVDYRQVISEMMFSIPLQRALGFVDFYTGSRNPDEIAELIWRRRSVAKSFVSLDYSKYDQSLPGWLIDVAFDILYQCFDQSEIEEWKWLWKAVVFDFTHAPILGPDAKLYNRADGVPSGSMFTQIIDTICNWLMIETWRNMASERDRAPHSLNMLICGDDNLIFLNDDRDAARFEQEMLSYISYVFGVKGQPDKLGHGEVGKDDPHFLSRTWRITGPWREWHELVAHMLYPERRRPYDRNTLMSPEMILWAYVLAYPAGMEELIDVERFVTDYRGAINTWKDSTLSDAVPGYLSFQKRYIDRTFASVVKRIERNKVA